MGEERPGATGTELAARVKELARSEGFELAGICRPEPSEHTALLDRWLAEGLHGEMSYLARPDAVARRQEPATTLPEARSVLVVTHGYDQPDPQGVPDDPSRGVVARYARGRDYHRVITKGLKRVHRLLEEELGREIPARVCVDTAPVLERELARRAGIGWFGKNTMLLNPARGSYYFLGTLFLGLELEPDAPFDADHCGTCTRCLEACPTGALLGRDADGAPIMDARLCISYLTIEHRGPIPRELRPLIGNRIYGCDICQEVCPFNAKFSEPATELGYAARGPGERPVGVEVAPDMDASRPGVPAGTPGDPDPTPFHPGTDGPRLVDLLETALSEDAWESFSRGSAVRRAGRAGFARNVCVSIGNWLSGAEKAPEEAVAVLARALSDPEALVRGHAAWALGRAASTEVRSKLEALREFETDPWVRGEVEAALLPSSR